MSNDNHHHLGTFHATINQLSPLETPERVPVVNLFQQQTPQSPTCIAHGMQWYMDDENVVRDIGGIVSSLRWYIKTTIGDHLTFGSNVTKRLVKSSREVTTINQLTHNNNFNELHGNFNELHGKKVLK